MTKRIFLLIFSFLAALLIAACDGGGGPSFKLTVSVSGNGTVTSSDNNIDCPSDCDQTYTESTQVTLEAEPADGETFSGWSGAGCTGTSACIVTVDGAKNVTARFSGEGGGGGDGTFLFQAFVEAGQGTLSSADNNINCSSNPNDDAAGCARQYPEGSTVVITAEAADGFVFDRFDGSSCSANGNVCTYTMSKDRDSRVSFRPEGADVFTVATDADDAEEYTTANPDLGLTVGTVDLDSGDIDLNYDELGKISQLVGIRFEEVSVQAGETVSEAYIEFVPAENDATVPTLTITAEVNPDPQSFAATDSDISSRQRTSTTVTWSPEAWERGRVAGVTRTPDLFGLMQEAGWTSGGAVVFIIEGDGSDAQRSAESRKGGAPDAPRLVVDYQ